MTWPSSNCSFRLRRNWDCCFAKKSCGPKILSLAHRMSQYSSRSFWIVMRSHRSVLVHCLYVTVSKPFSSSSKISLCFIASVPGQNPHWPRKHSGRPRLHDIMARKRGYSYLTLSLRAFNISLTFWCIVQTHTQCVPEPQPEHILLAVAQQTLRTPH